MSAPIRQLSLWQAPKFLVNSRLGLFSATTQSSGSWSLHLTWLPLSRSYGYILPSSLTRVLPRTLGFSPRIPVSVYGTGGRAAALSLEAFLDSVGSTPSPPSLVATHHASRLQGTDLPVPHAARLHTDFHSRAGLPSCVTPSLKQSLPVPESQPDVHLLRLLPRIRSRLTLGRRSLPRNPYAFGSPRYLTVPLPPGRNAPLPRSH